MDILKQLLLLSKESDDIKCATALYMIGEQINAEVSKFCARYGLTLTQNSILNLLLESDEMELTINELNELLPKKTNTSRSVSQLINKRFVTKRRSEDDERIVFVKITEKGIKLVNESNTSILSEYKTGLTKKEAKELYSLLLKVIEFQEFPTSNK